MLKLQRCGVAAFEESPGSVTATVDDAPGWGPLLGGAGVSSATVPPTRRVNVLPVVTSTSVREGSGRAARLRVTIFSDENPGHLEPLNTSSPAGGDTARGLPE
jgi:hypothetical protein